MEDLRNKETRHPHLIVGDVGTGKTAVLIQLTKLLARKGAVPVPLRLRDCDKELNFREAAHTRFKEQAALYRVPEAESDRIWQQLLKDNKVVVLADGLEESLQDLESLDAERDNMIRLAIHNVCKERLPAVIASRPHTPLRGTEASITKLEPLSDQDALAYLRRRGGAEDDVRLQHIVERAVISDSPLYLQITDDLNTAGLLNQRAPGHDRDIIDTRGVDRVQLRLHLLETWVNSLIDGYLHKEVSLDVTARKATIEQLSALACVGLHNDSLVVNFSDFIKTDISAAGDLSENEQVKLQEKNAKIDRLYKGIGRKLEQRLKELNWPFDPQLATTHGQQLGVVEQYSNSFRFQHSLMQAYLGSRYLSAALHNPDHAESPDFRQGENATDYLDTALENPGREFLFALVLCTRRCGSIDTPGVTLTQADSIVDSLVKAAKHRSGKNGTSRKLDIKTINLYSAAVQIIPETEKPRFAELTGQMRRLIEETQEVPEKDRARFERQARGLKDFFSGMPSAEIAKIGEEVDRLADCIRERKSIPLAGRARLAQEIDLARTDKDVTPAAHRGALREAVNDLSDKTCEAGETRRVSDEAHSLEEARILFIADLGEAMRRAGQRSSTRDGQAREWHQDFKRTYQELFQFAMSEPSYSVRVALAQTLGEGGNIAYEALRDDLKTPPDTPAGKRQWRTDEEWLRDFVMSAWLAPMLVGSVSSTGESLKIASSSATKKDPQLLADDLRKEREEEKWEEGKLERDIREELERWLKYVTSDGRDNEFIVNLRIALAQGFKYAANWRRQDPYAPTGSRAYLAERAKSMFHQVDFWYSRLTLLHALTLWALPDVWARTASADHQVQSPQALVRQWMVMRDEEDRPAAGNRAVEHPFVAEAARMSALALQTRQPERFIWMDESGVASKTGSGPAPKATTPRRPLWIPPSAGWSTLDPHAQQLLADVLLYLNLAEGGEEPGERERRLAKTATSALPSCIIRNRAPLHPEHTVGAADRRQAGARSACASDCKFDLCPYPPTTQNSTRAELSEAFCRRQRVILGTRGRLRGLRFRVTAPWQGQTKRKLRKFWTAMGERARRF